MKRALIGVVASSAAILASCASLSGLTNGGGGDAATDASSKPDAESASHDDSAVGDARRDTHVEPAQVDSGGDGEAGTGCVIGGKAYVGGAPNPTNMCESCEPSVATSGWSNALDGTSCGMNGICYLGGCVSGCEIGGVYYGTNAPNPDDPCQSCQPAGSTSAWAALADGTVCGNDQLCGSGQCGTQCDIEGAVYSSGTLEPDNLCDSCQPGTSASAWSALSDGASCGTGEVCSGGSCGPGCFIGGVLFQAATANVNNGCQSCQPAASTTAWSNVGDGTSCGNGQICSGGQCGTQCDIGSTVYAAGVANPANLCQVCQPGASTSAWTGLTDGTSCGAGEICSAASCVPGCFISMVVTAANAPNPAGACQKCEPATSTTTWTSLANGASCGTKKFCVVGACVLGCLIGGTPYISTASDPSNSCLSCQPNTSTTNWTDVADGTSCGAGPGRTCSSGSCTVSTGTDAG